MIQFTYHKRLAYSSLDASLFGQPETIFREISISNCTASIVSGEGGASGINFSVEIRDSRGNLLEIREYSLLPDWTTGAGDLFQQGYEYLKTLPAYADAVDMDETI